MSDRELLARVARAFERADPVVGVADAVRAGALAGSGAGALVLVTAGVRGGRLLGFVGGGGRVDAEVDGDGVAVSLSGVTTADGELRVRWPRGKRLVDVDAWGRFVVDGLPAGPLSFVVRAADGVDAVGPWFVA